MSGQLVCYECGKKDFVNYWELINHERCCGGPLDDTPVGLKSDRNPPLPDQQLFCWKCRRVDFADKYDLREHVKSCKGVKRAPAIDISLALAKRLKEISESQDFPVDSIGATDCAMSFLQRRMDVQNETTNDVGFGDMSDGGLGLGDVGEMDASNDLAREPLLPYNTKMRLASSNAFQIKLNNILSKHRTDLSLHDELIDLFQEHCEGDRLDFFGRDLRPRKGFIKLLEDIYKTTPMKPKNISVKLNSGSATVSVFDVEAMIMSILTDDNLMKSENLAPGYDFLTGKPTTKPTVYDEFHTGEMWEIARAEFCVGANDTPLALVIFGDKSHFDLHGSLATMPLIFTLTCFN